MIGYILRLDGGNDPKACGGRQKGGGITKKARLELEEKIGRRIVSGENYLPPKTGKKLGGK